MTRVAQVPLAPEGLNANAAVAWSAMARTIASARPVTDSDCLKMEIAATAWARWRSLERKISELGVGNPLAGELSKGTNGVLQVSALRTAATQAFDEFNSLAAALGVDSKNDLATIDLFGYPDRPGRGKKGRPSFRPTPRDRNRVRLLLAMGWSNARIASALEVSGPTLQKYFSVELEERAEMRDRLDARRMELAMDQANAGNISALRELGKLIEQQEMALAGKAFNNPAPKEEPKLGKKEQLVRDASQPTPDWEALLDSPSRPN